jgi:hypothetical protein
MSTIRLIKNILKEAVVYKAPDYKRMADTEHDETGHQSMAIKNGDMPDVHPRIAAAIHSFAGNKPAFNSALRNSSIERIKPGTEVNNSEIGQGAKAVEDKTKLTRVRKQIGSGQGIDRPIILRHTDSEGNQHHHLLAGNTRATTVGYGVQAHIIDVK